MFHGDISYTEEAIYADKLSIVYDDIHLTRSTQNTIREFIRNHPTPDGVLQHPYASGL
jgi:hypothetical protein